MRNLINYYVSQYHNDHTQRHIIIKKRRKDFYLCGYKSSLDYPTGFYLEDYILGTINIPNKPLCKKCIAKLPEEIRKQVVYNLIVTKLKS